MSVNKKKTYDLFVKIKIIITFLGNRDTITANPGDITNEIGNHNQIMSSPFFPAIYPRDFSVEHLLTCMVESCRIHILFTDFQVIINI